MPTTSTVENPADSGETYYDPRRAVRAVTCPRCHAPAGFGWCWSATGNHGAFHAARYKAAGVRPVR